MSQLLIAIIAGCIGYLNGVPVNLMINKGVKLWESKEFHNANFVLKFIICAVVAYYSQGGFNWLWLIDTFLFGVIMWLVFDIVLNLFIHKEWDYVGQTSAIDKLLYYGFNIEIFKKKIYINGFGEKAGEIKAATCLLFIIGLNILRAKI
jgi:RsiW-degrading membrane proteinase PrsW (M82 family)